MPLALLRIRGLASEYLNAPGLDAHDSINDRIESLMVVQCWFDDMRRFFLELELVEVAQLLLQTFVRKYLNIGLEKHRMRPNE